MTEQWKTIPGYEGHYEISDLGRVRSLDRIVPRSVNSTRFSRGRIIAPRIDSLGRHAIRLYKDGKSQEFRLYRLVLEVFMGPCPEGSEGCHNNGNALDDRLANLRWDTRSSNMHDQVVHGVHGQASKTHCPQGHPYSGDNLRAYVSRGRNVRECRTCIRARSREKTRRLNMEKLLVNSASNAHDTAPTANVDA